MIYLYHTFGRTHDFFTMFSQIFAIHSKEKISITGVIFPGFTPYPHLPFFPKQCKIHFPTTFMHFPFSKINNTKKPPKQGIKTLNNADAPHKMRSQSPSTPTRKNLTFQKGIRTHFNIKMFLFSPRLPNTSPEEP